MVAGFLTNQDIRRLYESGKRPVQHPEHGGSTSYDDLAVHPAKIDLHVGLIYAPGSPKDERKKNHILRSGGVAYVETLEDICLPPNMMGLMFPKSGHVAQMGLLLTNVGHVDPGYKGKLTYTVINMSPGRFVLKAGDALAYLMLYQLTNASEPAWIGNSASLTAMAELSDSADFMDLNQRMEKSAQDVADRRLFQILTPALMFSFVVALLTVATSVVLLGTPRQRDLEGKVMSLERRLNDVSLDERVKALEGRFATAPSGNQRKP